MRPGTRPASPRPEGRTHWLRSILVILPAMLAAGGLGSAMSVGALAVDLELQDKPLGIATSSVYGTDFGASVVDVTTVGPDGSKDTRKVLRMGFADGVINGLCLSQEQTVMGATYTLLLTLGDHDAGSWEVRTTNTVLDVKDATGVLDMDGVVDLNVNGADVRTFPLDSPEHRFGIQAKYAKFDKITGRVQDIQIPGVLNTPKLSLTVKPGKVACPAPPAPRGTPGTS